MITARHIMNSDFHSLHPHTTLADAAKEFKQASEKEGRRVFGMMVIEDEKLVGILSMYDLLLFLQPKHVHIWGEMSDIDISGLFENISNKTREIRVSDIMSTDVVTVEGNSNVFSVLEIMNRKHIRRVPVIDNDQVLGIVYISDLFFHFVDNIA